MHSLFKEIYQLYYKDVFKIAYSYTLNTVESEDITQQVFMKLYKNISKFASSDINVKKWLLKVASNESKDLLKSYWRAKRTNYKLDEIVTARQDKSLIIFDILNKFDKKYRLPFYLYYYEGYTSKEIAEILKISKSTVEVRLFRIKRMLKEELGDCVL